MTTMYDHLVRHAGERPAAVALSLWHNGEVREDRTYERLLADVAAMISGLCASGARPGDRVLMLLPNDFSFVTTLLACSAAGLVAVPAPTPTISRTSAFRERLSRIASDCRPRLAVVPRRWIAGLGDLLEDTSVHAWEDLATGTAEPGRTAAHPVAFLQYTSGSTSAPRGVVVTHESIAISCAQAAEAYRETAGDAAVTWVPLYHDMGLVTGVVRPLFGGYRSILMSPEEFVRSPRSWLTAIATTRATFSSAPNFAYDLCTRKIPDPDRLDLSGWRVARNAAEVVSPETVRRFTEHFAGAGFRPAAMCPSYGLAEATLTVTTSRPGADPVTVRVRAAELEAGQVVVADDGDREIASSGTPVTGAGVRIDARSGEDVGEIMVSGAQMSPGYWPSTGHAAQWRRTGDLGFLLGDELFVLGRIDDVLVLRGRKHYMTDVSAACRDIEGLRPGRLGAFQLPDSDRVVLVSEVRGTGEHSFDELATAVIRSVAREAQLRLTDVVFVAAGDLPVTTSGKVRVSAIRRSLEKNELPVLHAHQSASI